MESEPPPRQDSLWPHARAIITNPSVWRWGYRVLLPMAMSFGIKPTWDKWQQIAGDHVQLTKASKNVERLLSTATRTKDVIDREATAWRNEARLSARARVEFIAIQKKQPVQTVLDDYDELVDRWTKRDPDCLTTIHCPSPSEAADMALAVRRPR